MTSADNSSAYGSMNDAEILSAILAALVGRDRLTTVRDAALRVAAEIADGSNPSDVLDAEIVDTEIVACDIADGPVASEVAPPSELERQWDARQEAGLLKLAEIRRSMAEATSKPPIDE